MPNKILLSENSEKLLIKIVLENHFFPSYEKVCLLKKFMDEHFLKKTISDVDSYGMPKNTVMVFIKDKNGAPINQISNDNLFYLMQDKFKNIYDDKKRDVFIKQFLKDWINGKITDNCLLSNNNLTT